MRKKQAIAWMLSLAMALAPLSVCSRQSISGADDEEMTRELKVTGEVIEVATNEQGVYNVPSLVEGKEPTYETCEAEVTGFTNDNGTVHLSFQAEAPGAILSWTYTIRFAGSDCYVVVQTGPVVSDVTIQEVDYDVQISELANYKPTSRRKTSFCLRAPTSKMVRFS